MLFNITRHCLLWFLVSLDSCVSWKQQRAGNLAACVEIQHQRKDQQDALQVW